MTSARCNSRRNSNAGQGLSRPQMMWWQQRSPKQWPSQVVVTVDVVADLWMAGLLAMDSGWMAWAMALCLD